MKQIALFLLVTGCLYIPAANTTSILELGSDTTNVHKIELLSSNVFDGTYYVWTYKVTSGSGPTTKSISHWVIDICQDYYDHATDSGGTNIEEKFTSADPTLGITGLKFDDTYSDGEMRMVSIFMTESLEITQGQVGIKSGQNLFYGFIDAPSCDCQEDHAPEPATMALIGAGILGMTARRRKLF